MSTLAFISLTMSFHLIPLTMSFQFPSLSGWIRIHPLSSNLLPLVLFLIVSFLSGCVSLFNCPMIFNQGQSSLLLINYCIMFFISTFPFRFSCFRAWFFRFLPFSFSRAYFLCVPELQTSGFLLICCSFPLFFFDISPKISEIPVLFNTSM